MGHPDRQRCRNSELMNGIVGLDGRRLDMPCSPFCGSSPLRSQRGLATRIISAARYCPLLVAESTVRNPSVGRTSVSSPASPAALLNGDVAVLDLTPDAHPAVGAWARLAPPHSARRGRKREGFRLGTDRSTAIPAPQEFSGDSEEKTVDRSGVRCWTRTSRRGSGAARPDFYLSPDVLQAMTQWLTMRCRKAGLSCCRSSGSTGEVLPHAPGWRHVELGSI